MLNLVKGIDKASYEVVLWCNHTTLAELAAPFAAEIILTDFSLHFGFGNPTNVMTTVSNLVQLIRDGRNLVQRINPKLILCNGLSTCQWMVPVSLMSGIALISYQHTRYLPKSRLLSLAHGASHIVGVSQFTIQHFIDDGFPLRHTSVIYNGVEDLTLHSPVAGQLRKELGINKDAFIVTSLSALVPWKKVDIVIDSFRLLANTGGKPAVLLIVGDGPCQQSLKEQAQGLSVIFCGWRDDIANVFASSDCIIITAELEAFALTIIEAASMSLPVVGARAGGVREVIRDGENGYFSEPGSARSFAHALTRLKNDPELRTRLGKHARSIYEKHYRVERMVAELTTLIEQVAEGNPSYHRSALLRFACLLGLSIRLACSKLLSILSRTNAKNKQFQY